MIGGNGVGNAGIGTVDIFRLGGATNSTIDASAPHYQNFDAPQKTGSSTWG